MTDETRGLLGELKVTQVLCKMMELDEMVRKDEKAQEYIEQATFALLKARLEFQKMQPLHMVHEMLPKQTV